MFFVVLHNATITDLNSLYRSAYWIFWLVPSILLQHGACCGSCPTKTTSFRPMIISASPVHWFDPCRLPISFDHLMHPIRSINPMHLTNPSQSLCQSCKTFWYFFSMTWKLSGRIVRHLRDWFIRSMRFERSINPNRSINQSNWLFHLLHPSPISDSNDEID